ncbi:glycosyltransferase family 4 protein [Microbacterium sp. NPDC058062]|uniref:glycosyltransferase family 4 protein n=1 Tax=Microbacterium sp. NPDC058062 TaxID=3346320 RepID=UPI0036DB219D
MGFPPPAIHFGSIPANFTLFDSVNPRGSGGDTRRNRAFLSVSRLSPEKGLDTLISAYATYRQEVSDPWELWIAGTGDVTIPEAAGIRVLGFLWPAEVSEMMHSASALVLASSFEPWGVVLQEGALAGLPLIATEDCGGVGSMLHNGVNGVVVRSNDVPGLARALRDIASASPTRWAALSSAGQVIARRATPTTWVASLEWIRERTLPGHEQESVSRGDFWNLARRSAARGRMDSDPRPHHPASDGRDS